jgi:hypothetical protein
MKLFGKSKAPQPEPIKPIIQATIPPPCPVCGCEGLDALNTNPSECCRRYMRTWWASIGA